MLPSFPIDFFLVASQQIIPAHVRFLEAGIASGLAGTGDNETLDRAASSRLWYLPAWLRPPDALPRACP
jgi:hypothetical protein